MEFPKKFTKSYEGKKPVKIIKGTGEQGSIKIVEYKLIREIGKMGVYKK